MAHVSDSAPVLSKYSFPPALTQSRRKVNTASDGPPKDARARRAGACASRADTWAMERASRYTYDNRNMTQAESVWQPRGYDWAGLGASRSSYFETAPAPLDVIGEPRYRALS